MNRWMKARFYSFVFLFLLNSSVYADAIGPEFLALALGGFLGVILFILLTESFVLALLLKARFLVTMGMVFIANAVSTFTGFLLTSIIDPALDSGFRQDLYHAMRGFLWITLAFYFVSFLVSIILEYIVINVWRNGGPFSCSRKRLLQSVFWANLFPYLVLVSLHFYLEKPTHNIRSFTLDTSWASQPARTIVYKGDGIRQINTDGSDNKIYNAEISLPTRVFPDGIESYVEVADASSGISVLAMHTGSYENYILRPPTDKGLFVNRDNKELIRIIDDPGIGHSYGRRGFYNPTILPGGKEVVFEDSAGYIYLLDVENRRVGTLCVGMNHVMLEE